MKVGGGVCRGKAAARPVQHRNFRCIRCAETENKVAAEAYRATGPLQKRCIGVARALRRCIEIGRSHV